MSQASVSRISEGVTQPHKHEVRFYESMEYLSTSVAGYLADGFRNGNGMVVIARPEHRKEIARHLQAEGFDLDAAVRIGQFKELDAHETLQEFMDSEQPNPERFASVIGDVIENCRMGRENAPVLAYGEMVDILRRDGNCEAAIRLEELWNELVQKHPFELVCAYSIKGFHKADHRPQFERICTSHSRVIPTEHYMEKNDDERLRQISLLQQESLALRAELEHRKEIQKALLEALDARKYAEESLRKTEQQFRSILKNAAEGLHWVGPDGEILWANDAEANLLGYSAEEYIGHNIREFHADAEIIENILSRLTAGETLRNYEARLRAKDGSIRHVLINSNVLWDEGKFIHTQCFTRDVTDLKQAQQALFKKERAARAEAEVANRTKDEFLAILSHELRTPLNAVLGWANILEARPDADLAVRAVEVIKRNAAMQKRMIEDLLDLARILIGKMVIKNEAVDLPSIVNLALDSVAPAAAAKRIRLDRDFHDSIPVVTGDVDRLQQVISNLVSNSIKFTPENGYIQLRLAKTQLHVEISVQDTGKGITPDLLPYVFDRFRQGDSSPTRLHDGLGLGLTIVRHLVEAHRGAVNAYSAGEGLGSTFTVRLPVRTSAAAS